MVMEFFRFSLFIQVNPIGVTTIFVVIGAKVKIPLSH